MDSDRQQTLSVDSERQAVLDRSSNVQSFSWRGLEVTVTDRATKQRKILVDKVDGIVKAGECCAIMGPSGSGKTTLLNALTSQPARSSTVDGILLVNGKPMPISTFRKLSCFVQNNEPFIGALTVSETLHFASRLAGPRKLEKNTRKEQVDFLIKSLGLVEQSHTIIGTSFRKSISDGQKRRVAIARQLVACPKILFLDEPTSGLDSASSFEVIQYIRCLAKRNNLVVICSIHQPSITTFNLFDKLLLMSTGKLLYFGPVATVADYFSNAYGEIPSHVNPAEYLLDLVNTDFSQNKRAISALLHKLQLYWNESSNSKHVLESISDAEESAEAVCIDGYENPSMVSRIITLMHRDLVKAFRDPMAYGIRFAFVISFAFLLGTVWLQLDYNQESIQPLVTQTFFTLCFISLSAIIYAPAFIEDYLNFVYDYQNGFYGAVEFAVSNFLIGIPYLFSSSLVFSLITYWLSSPLREATAFFNWTLWIFLTSFAAEALIVMVVVIYPNFMFAIACASFLNSLLLCSQGFFITEQHLNAFYKFAFHYWNYLYYSFHGIMVRQFANSTFQCGERCQCLYNSTLATQCQIAGQAVLEQYGFGVFEDLGKNVGIMIAISLGYRLASFLLLKIKN